MDLRNWSDDIPVYGKKACILHEQYLGPQQVDFEDSKDEMFSTASFLNDTDDERAFCEPEKTRGGAGCGSHKGGSNPMFSPSTAGK